MEMLILASNVVKSDSRGGRGGEAAYYEAHDRPWLTAGTMAARFATAIAMFGIFAATLSATA